MSEKVIKAVLKSIPKRGLSESNVDLFLENLKQNDVIVFLADKEWRSEKPTEKQKKFIKDNKLSSKPRTKGEAFELIQEFISNPNRKLSYCYDDCHDWEEAKESYYSRWDF